MGQHTKIEWCDSTVNPTGFQCCGCELWNKQRRDCYAGRFAERVGGKGAFDQPVVLKPNAMLEAARWPDLRGQNRDRKGAAPKPWLDGRPRIIFIGDMADTLQPAVPFMYLKTHVVDVVTSEAGRRHIWMWLTKQAKQMVKFQEWLLGGFLGHTEWPENLWPGVSVTSERTTWRIDELAKIKSAHRFISYEPAWGPVDFSRWTSRAATVRERSIALIIIGGQSGAGAKDHPFKIAWAANTIDLCEHDHVACFVKQLGAHCVLPLPAGEGRGEGERARLKLKHPKGGDWSEWPPGLRVRQFPEVLQKQTKETKFGASLPSLPSVQNP